jgi:hypothetical protein
MSDVIFYVFLCTQISILIYLVYSISRGQGYVDSAFSHTGDLRQGFDFSGYLQQKQMLKKISKLDEVCFGTRNYFFQVEQLDYRVAHKNWSYHLILDENASCSEDNLVAYILYAQVGESLVIYRIGVRSDSRRNKLASTLLERVINNHDYKNVYLIFNVKKIKEDKVSEFNKCPGWAFLHTIDARLVTKEYPQEIILSPCDEVYLMKSTHSMAELKK